jgi:hypothetical protein
MMATRGSRYRWRVGEIEITRVLEFEATLFEPAVMKDVGKRHREIV